MNFDLPESEETEVKDIEWLKEHITIILGGKVKYKDKNVVDDKYFVGLNNAYVAVLEMLESLDVETLTPEWIDELIHYSTDQDAFGNIVRIEIVPAKYLRNLLVPKQENTEMNVNDLVYFITKVESEGLIVTEKPGIPDFVADWIEGNKQFEEKWNDYSKEDAMNDTVHFTIYGLFADYPATNSHVELRKPVLKWLSVDRGNYFKLVNAVRYGYEVEEEPLYRARLKVITDEFIVSYLRTQSSDAEDRLKALEIGSKYIHEDYRHLSEFTEDELKRLGIWDSGQWEVEELGE